MGKHKLREALALAGAKLPVRRGLSRGMFAMQCGALYGDKEKTQRKEQTGINHFQLRLDAVACFRREWPHARRRVNRLSDAGWEFEEEASVDLLVLFTGKTTVSPFSKREKEKPPMVACHER